jgi:hypothetical protein
MNGALNAFVFEGESEEVRMLLMPIRIQSDAMPMRKAA